MLAFFFSFLCVTLTSFFCLMKEIIDRGEDSSFLTTGEIMELVENSALDMDGSIALLRSEFELRVKIIVFLFTLSTRNYDKPLIKELLSKVIESPHDGSDVFESSLLDVTNSTDDAFAAVSYVDREKYWRDLYEKRYEEGYTGDQKLWRWPEERKGRGAYAHRTCDEAIEF